MKKDRLTKEIVVCHTLKALSYNYFTRDKTGILHENKMDLRRDFVIWIRCIGIFSWNGPLSLSKNTDVGSGNPWVGHTI